MCGYSANDTRREGIVRRLIWCVVFLLVIVTCGAPSLSWKALAHTSSFTSGDVALLNTLLLTCSEKEQLARELFRMLAAVNGYESPFPNDPVEDGALITWLDGFYQHLSANTALEGIGAVLELILPGAVECLRKLGDLEGGSGPPELRFVLRSVGEDTGTDISADIAPVQLDVELVLPEAEEPDTFSLIGDIAGEVVDIAGPSYSIIKAGMVLYKVHERHPEFIMSLVFPDAEGEEQRLTLTLEEGWTVYSGYVAMLTLCSEGYQRLVDDFDELPETATAKEICDFIEVLGKANEVFSFVIDSIELGERLYEYIEDPSGDIVLDYKLWSKALIVAGATASLSTIGAPVGAGLTILGVTLEYLGDRIVSRCAEIAAKGKLQWWLGKTLPNLLAQWETLNALINSGYFDGAITQAEEYWEACLDLHDALESGQTGLSDSPFAYKLRTYLDSQGEYAELLHERAQTLKETALGALDKIEDAIKTALDYEESGKSVKAHLWGLETVVLYYGPNPNIKLHAIPHAGTVGRYVYVDTSSGEERLAVVEFTEQELQEVEKDSPQEWAGSWLTLPTDPINLSRYWSSNDRRLGKWGYYQPVDHFDPNPNDLWKSDDIVQAVFYGMDVAPGYYEVIYDEDAPGDAWSYDRSYSSDYDSDEEAFEAIKDRLFNHFQVRVKPETNGPVTEVFYKYVLDKGTTGMAHGLDYEGWELPPGWRPTLQGKIQDAAEWMEALQWAHKELQTLRAAEEGFYGFSLPELPEFASNRITIRKDAKWFVCSRQPECYEGVHLEGGPAKVADVKEGLVVASEDRDSALYRPSVYAHVPFPDKVYIYWNASDIGTDLGDVVLCFSDGSEVVVTIESNEHIRSCHMGSCLPNVQPLACCCNWWDKQGSEALPYPPPSGTHAEPAFIYALVDKDGVCCRRIDLLVIDVPSEKQGLGLTEVRFDPSEGTTFQVFHVEAHSRGNACNLEEPIIEVEPGTHYGSLSQDDPFDLYRFIVPGMWVEELKLSLEALYDRSVFELALRRGVMPTDAEYDCFALESTNREGACLLEDPTPGFYYLSVHRLDRLGGKGDYRLSIELEPAIPPEEYLDDGSVETAIPWNTEAPVFGQFEKSEDADYYTWTAPESAICTIVLSDVPENVTPYLALSCSNCSSIEYKFGDNAGRSISLTVDVNAGETYCACVANVYDNISDEVYILSMTESVPDPNEPNDTLDQATCWDFTSGEIQGYFCELLTSRGERDYYALTVPESLGSVLLMVHLDDVSENILPALTVMDASGDTIASSTAQSLGEGLRLTVNANAGETLHVVVRLLQGHLSKQPYTLSVTTLPDSNEPDGSFDQATVCDVTAGSAHGYFCGHDWDRDYYVLTVPDGISLLSLHLDDVPVDVVPELEARKSEWPSSCSQRGSAGQPVSLTMPASAGETVYVAVASTSGSARCSSQRYVLSWTTLVDPNEPDNSLAEATEWDLTDGAIHGFFVDKSDWYAARVTDAEEPMVIVLHLTDIPETVKPTLYVKSVSSSKLGESRSSEEGQAIDLAVLAYPSELLYIRVSCDGYGAHKSPYALLTTVIPDRHEPNDDFEQATVWDAFSGSICGYFCERQSTREDYYIFRVPESVAYGPLALRVDDVAANIKAELSVYDSSHRQLARSQSPTEGAPVEVTFPAEGGETYFARIKPRPNHTSAQPYVLSVQQSSTIPSMDVDLRIDASLKPGHYQVDQTIELYVYVMSLREAPLEQPKVSILLDGEEIAMMEFPSALDVWTMKSRTFTFTPSSPGEYQFSFRVDPENDTAELNEDNNEVSVTVVVSSSTAEEPPLEEAELTLQQWADQYARTNQENMALSYGPENVRVEATATINGSEGVVQTDIYVHNKHQSIQLIYFEKIDPSGPDQMWNWRQVGFESQ